MKIRLITTIFASALALTACGGQDTANEASDQIAEVEQILSQDCDMNGAVNNCTDWLTDLVSASYSAYEAAGSPDGEAETRYQYLDENSSMYSNELDCPNKDWLEPDCVARHVAIKSNAEGLLEELQTQ